MPVRLVDHPLVTANPPRGEHPREPERPVQMTVVTDLKIGFGSMMVLTFRFIVCSILWGFLIGLLLYALFGIQFVPF